MISDPSPRQNGTDLHRSQSHCEGRTATILVVEDDPSVAELLRAMVNSVSGWGAIVVGDAEGALDVLRHVPVDALVLDVHLPGGMSGPQLLDHLRRTRGGKMPRAILMSAGALQPEVEQAMRWGCVERFVPKPFDVDEVMSVIHDATQRELFATRPSVSASAHRMGAA